MITTKKKPKKITKLSREDFYTHMRVQKLASMINKKTLSGFNYMYIKDKALIKFLQDNRDWLDYVGILVEYRKDKKQLFLKWESKL